MEKFYLPFRFGEITKIALMAAKSAYRKEKPVRPLPFAWLVSLGSFFVCLFVFSWKLLDCTDINESLCVCCAFVWLSKLSVCLSVLQVIAVLHPLSTGWQPFSLMSFFSTWGEKPAFSQHFTMCLNPLTSSLDITQCTSITRCLNPLPGYITY